MTISGLTGTHAFSDMRSAQTRLFRALVSVTHEVVLVAGMSNIESTTPALHRNLS